MEVKRLARRAAQLGAPVLLHGETGTGKELLAHAIHAGGPRPIQALRHGERGGHAREPAGGGILRGGAGGLHRGGPQAAPGQVRTGGPRHPVPGRDRRHAPGNLQAKLLRVLQEHEFEPLGSNRVIRVDVRILAATSQDLEAMAADGRFRKDLFYRLNVLNIPCRPCGSGWTTWSCCASTCWRRPGCADRRPGRELSAGAMDLLRRHAWPGNVRELQNVLERAMMNTDEHRLEVADFQGW
jgi:transcriptional regulator with PAS, ATPase and Fis domain